MKWSIVTDSSCDLNDREITLAENISFSKVPFMIGVGNTSYTDDSDLDIAEMLDDMECCPAASRTSCPSPAAYMQLFEQAENTVAITISSNLSGSYNSAVLAKNMVLKDYPEKNIFVLDSRSTGPALAKCVQKTAEYIGQELSFANIAFMLEKYAAHYHTVFALSSFNNLIKNGRISRLAGFVAGKLGLWGIGAGSKEGKIEVKGKVRGAAQVISKIIDDMKEHCFEHGEIIISHCQNPELAQRLKERIMQTWENTKVKVLSTGGICSFYAERKGLIVSY